MLGIALMAAGLWTASPLLPAHAATVNVSVGNHFFEDNVAPAGEIAAVAGDTIKFTVANGTHDLHIDELNVHTPKPLKSGEFANLVINQPGTYELYCAVKHGSNTHRTTLRIAAPNSPTTTDGSGGSSGSTAPPTSASSDEGDDHDSSSSTGGSGGSTGSAGGSTSGGGSGSAAGGTGTRTGSATASTNGAGQLVTAAGEVIATSEAGSGRSDDEGALGSEAGSRDVEGGEAGTVTLELFAADGTRIQPTSSTDNSNLVGLLGIVLLMAGAVVLFAKPRKKKDEDGDEAAGDGAATDIIFTDAPADGGEYDGSEYEYAEDWEDGEHGEYEDSGEQAEADLAELEHDDAERDDPPP